MRRLSHCSSRRHFNTEPRWKLYEQELRTWLNQSGSAFSHKGSRIASDLGSRGRGQTVTLGERRRSPSFPQNGQVCHPWCRQ